MDNSVQPQKARYNPQFKQEVDIYIEDCQKNKITPSIKGFAERIGTDEQSIWAWANKKRKDKITGELTDQLARPQFLAQVKKLENLSQPKQEKHPNLKKGNLGNHGQGRPTKYDPKFAKELIDFFKIPPNYEKELPHTTAKGGEWTDYKLMSNKLPTFLDFANKIGVDDDTLENWAEAKYPDDYEDEKLRGQLRYPEFFGAYARAKKFQKWFIIENGLNGLYNPQFAIFVAKNITDMKDKQELDHNPDGRPIQVETVKRVSNEPTNG